MRLKQGHAVGFPSNREGGNKSLAVEPRLTLVGPTLAEKPAFQQPLYLASVGLSWSHLRQSQR